MLVLVSLAFAGTGYWHPADVSAQSAVFTAASERSAAQAAEAQDRVRTLAAALADYDEALGLLGDAAPAAERERLDALEKGYNRSFAVLQEFADDLVADFDAAFGEAMQQVLPAHAGAERCIGEIADGPQVPGMRARTRKNPACTGTDLNPGIAAGLDADPALKARLDEVLSRPWPALDVPITPVPPIGGAATRTISVSGFWKAAAPGALRAIRTQDEDARDEFAAAIEQGASTEVRKAMVERARAVDAATAGRRAALAAPVHARAATVFAKKAPDAGWCAQPGALGGCTGTDDTAALTALLRADAKLARSLP